MNSAVNPGDTAWVLVETWHRGKPTALGAASGAVAGLVAIAPLRDSWDRLPPSPSAE